jgi:hypothetical protein
MADSLNLDIQENTIDITVGKQDEINLTVENPIINVQVENPSIAMAIETPTIEITMEGST